MDQPGGGGEVDCYIWRLVSVSEMLLKLLHGDWALLGLGFSKDGMDTLSGITPVEVLEPLGLFYSVMVALAAGWV